MAAAELTPLGMSLPRLHATVRVIALVSLLVLLQVAFVSQLRVDRISADVLLLFSVACGVAAGPDRGALVGFFVGLGYDVFLQTPFGLSALAYSLVGFAVGSLQSGILRATWWIPVVTAAGASAGGIVLFGVLGAMVGQPDFVSPRLALIAVVVGFMNAALAPAASRAVAWAFR